MFYQGVPGFRAVNSSSDRLFFTGSSGRSIVWSTALLLAVENISGFRLYFRRLVKNMVEPTPPCGVGRC